VLPVSENCRALTSLPWFLVYPGPTKCYFALSVFL
jgi:hypothetical protein